MQKKGLIVVGFLCAFLAVLAAWYFLPVTFLSGVAPNKIHSISILDGNSGRECIIREPDEIRYILVTYRASKCGETNFPWIIPVLGFGLFFFDESGKEVENLILNSSSTICKDPFLYCCDGGLCFDTLIGLSESSME